jgi:hypothetical protein
MTVVTGASIAFAAKEPSWFYGGLIVEGTTILSLLGLICKCRNLLFARFVLCNGMQMRPDEDDSLN